MRKINFYVDDSGTRFPDKTGNNLRERDWFALGGILIPEENEDGSRGVYQEFCTRWEITDPLHSIKIRHRKNEFSWIKQQGDSNGNNAFLQELGDMLISLPVIGLACVIDRPGYHNRYHAQYVANKWDLCKTAFSIIMERGAKYAVSQSARLATYVEESDKITDRNIKKYYQSILKEGSPFSRQTSKKYSPMSASDFQHCLVDLKMKRKSSPMMQIADLYLYPMCRGRYEEYRPFKDLSENNKLIDKHLEADKIDSCGIKYSCFEGWDSTQ